MSAQNFIFLACLEVAEKFVWWVVCKPILVFSLRLSQTEQLQSRQAAGTAPALILKNQAITPPHQVNLICSLKTIWRLAHPTSKFSSG